MPYINSCNHTLSSAYSPIETVAKWVSTGWTPQAVVSITMKGKINNNTTAGMLDTNIVGNPTNSPAKIGYDVDCGTNYAIWVVLWHI